MNSQDESAIRALYRKLTLTLIEKHLTITTMESATAGQLASLITDTEGSSAVLKGAFVTYCNEAKIQQGVSSEILDQYSVYSCETAGSMASAACSAYPSDISIGITGTMGNIDPANEAASVPGTVYFALLIKGKTFSYKETLPPQSTRLAYKLLVCKAVFDKLMPLLDNL